MKEKREHRKHEKFFDDSADCFDFFIRRFSSHMLLNSGLRFYEGMSSCEHTKINRQIDSTLNQINCRKTDALLLVPLLNNLEYGGIWGGNYRLGDDSSS